MPLIDHNKRHLILMSLIEKGVPMPRGRQGKSQGITKTLGDMEAGDSFLIPEDWNLGTVRATAHGSAGRTYTVRKVEDGRYRVWRIA